MNPNPAYIAALKDSVRDGAYPNLLGMTLADIAYDTCRIELEIGPRHFQPFGIVHGGVLATLIDTATFWAGFLRLPDDCGLVNVDLKLNYIRAVSKGKLRAEGICRRAGRQVSYTEASIYDETGDLLAARGCGGISLPDKGLKLGPAKFL